MNPTEFKAELWDLLMTEVRPINPSSDKKQLAIRCPFCGDSRKHANSTHFGIKINVNNEDEPVFFNCFLCSTSGVLTPSILRTLDINNLSLNSSLISFNKKALKGMNTNLGMRNNEFDFKVELAETDDERNLIKKKYFEERLGVTTTFEELAELKVVFKLGQFLRNNKIEKLTVGKDKAVMLHEDYMGFLTVRGEFINFRQVDNKRKGKRYEVYKVFNSLDNTRKFYTIPNEIDLLTPEPVTINISEGVFDILGVYYHVNGMKKKNQIYTAVCGAGYVNVIKYFIKMGVFDNVIVNIYSDDDKSPYYYKDLAKELKPWVQEINLFYNERSKDFGVPKHQIRVIRKRIPGR
jgi:hypothetical protein